MLRDLTPSQRTHTNSEDPTKTIYSRDAADQEVGGPREGLKCKGNK